MITILSCEFCTQQFNAYSKWGQKRFCSKGCSNKARGPRTKQVKDAIALSLKGQKRSSETITKYKETRKAVAKPKPKCAVCGADCPRADSKTCSRECFKVVATANAFKQTKHGGGHKGVYQGITCDSTYELAYLIYHLDMGVPIRRCDQLFEYQIDGVTKKYIPDFIVAGNVIEIKGFMSKTAQAKVDQNPSIVVIGKPEIFPYINYVKHTYKTNDLTTLYDVYYQSNKKASNK